MPHAGNQRGGGFVEARGVVGDNRQRLLAGRKRAERDQEPRLATPGHVRRTKPGTGRPQALGQASAGKHKAILPHDPGRGDLAVAPQLGNVGPLELVDVSQQIAPVADQLARRDALQAILILAPRIPRKGTVSNSSGPLATAGPSRLRN